MTLIDLSPAPPTGSVLRDLPVVVIGAGPVGLAAAAHLAERGIDFVVLEAGAVAESVSSWAHIRLFSPWKHLVDPAARRLLESDGWSAPTESLAPTGGELVERYLRPLSSLSAIAPRVRTAARVVAVSRRGMDRTRTSARASTPLVVRFQDSSGLSELSARAVIDASGTFRSPNPLGSNGLDPLGAHAVADRLLPAMPDVLGVRQSEFAGRHTTVVGAGHSAANTLVSLGELIRQEPSTRATWVIRSREATRVLTAESDELADRASLSSRLRRLLEFGVIDIVDRFEIVGLSREDDGMLVTGQRAGGLESFHTDLLVNATGFRPDLGMLREVRLDLDEVVEAPRRLAPLIDPNLHSCGTVAPHGVAELAHPEPGFFIAGMKSYGRAPTFLLATGYEQVRSITAFIDGDLEAARAVQLVLPATGVCSTSSAEACC
ncbi:FAD-dependent oxidoreductase [Salinibacterium soli]|uniref:FAD-dependent oxidoreductase n=1 Tax=Antiquaquibacter soli TaxID=3064523 RepID=A0ABT9BRH6_9MICO|nr:FAD-dependent oxidoreductase [Protaetiibacter sp. WY-16]MDO7883620.1 FAD-dependent oxidoreductase [Protaetiibacter sp. WY-16]